MALVICETISISFESDNVFNLVNLALVKYCSQFEIIWVAIFSCIHLLYALNPCNYKHGELVKNGLKRLGKGGQV